MNLFNKKKIKNKHLEAMNFMLFMLNFLLYLEVHQILKSKQKFKNIIGNHIGNIHSGKEILVQDLITSEGELALAILLAISKNRKLIGDNVRLKKIIFYLILGNFKYGLQFFSKYRLTAISNDLLKNNFQLFLF